VNDLARVGALIKSDYLTIFKLVGYRYALDAVTSNVKHGMVVFASPECAVSKYAMKWENFFSAGSIDHQRRPAGIIDSNPDRREQNTRNHSADAVDVSQTFSDGNERGATRWTACAELAVMRCEP
jgi:hypothetical protein